MVGALRAVDRRRAPEFGGDDDDGVGPRRPQPVSQRTDHRVEVPKLAIEPCGLRGVGIPAGGLDHHQPRTIGGGEQRGRQLADLRATASSTIGRSAIGPARV